MVSKIRTNKKGHISNFIPTKAVDQLLNQSTEGTIVFDLEGKVIAINQTAADLFGKNEVGKYIWQLHKIDSFASMRQLVLARRVFALAKQGIPQQCYWLETLDNKPTLALQLMMYNIDIEGLSLIFVKFTDITHTKLLEWVLLSLTKIGNQHEISDIVDDILKLLSDTFMAKHALVGLIDNRAMVRSVSHFQYSKKTDNISYPLADSPCENIQNDKKNHHITISKTDYPNDPLLKNGIPYTYIAAPITNTEGEVIGILAMTSPHPIKDNHVNNTLLQLFLERINLEVERMLSQRKLQFLASIPQQDPNPMIRILTSGEVIFANTHGKQILKFWQKIYQKLPEKIIDAAIRAQSSEQVVRLEMDADNKTYLFTMVWVSDFKHINIYGTDISQLKNTEQDMLNLARFDALTHIANRQYFEETLIEKMHEHQVERKKLALLLIDLDNFKTINDTLGHPIGDRLLQAASKRMVRCLRQDDFIARLGGDEFIVLLNHSTTEAAILVAEKIIEVLSRAFQFSEYHMKITASIGIAIYPETGVSPSDLLRHADIAMYQAKKTGKNRFAVFSKSFHFIQDKRNEIIRKELKFAVSRNELFVEYQPLFDMNSNEITGFEALLRWHHPEQGLILPNEFIPMAEQTGCVQIISQWMIEQAISDFLNYLQAPNDAKLSINVSLNQLHDARFLDSLTDIFTTYNIHKNKIILEISERSLTSHFKQVNKNLRKIHAAGFTLCLDNFGNPQVSLPKLLSLPISYVKLDQQLLLGIDKSNKHRVFYAGIIKLAKELDLDIIQKGIETKKQHDIVKLLGCKFSQGFYYCKPMKINDLVVLLKQYSSLPN